jgi:hypothetical protein
MEVLWRARADSAVTIPEICHELRRGDLPIPVYAEDSTEIDSIKQQIVRCSWSDVEIKFVSPEYMAIGEVSGQSEECEPRGGRWFQSYYVSHFNGDSSFALSQFAVAKVDSVARLALERAAKDLWRGGMCATVSEGINPDQLLEIGNAWYPWRISGRWMPIVWEPLEGPECTLHPGVDLVLTTTFTGDDSLRVPWSALARRIRGIEDAFTSPGGDLIVVRTADSLFVHLGDRQQLGRRIGSIPFAKHEIVMIQWATGRNVERWGHEIAAMTRRGFPGPKVVPAPKDP